MRANMNLLNWIIRALFAYFAVFGIAAATEERPNLLLIIVDDLGIQFGAYGDSTVPTPNLDRLATEGVLFNRGYVTAASCAPSRASMFTGLFPSQHGLYGLSQQDWSMRFQHRIRDGIPILPNALKDLGYRTAIFGKRHYAPTEAFAWDVQEENPRHLIERDVRLMAERVDDFIGRNAQEPFFVVASYVDPHRFGRVFTPFQRLGLPENPLETGDVEPLAKIGFDSEKIREDAAGYFNMVKRLDYGLGLLYEKLEARGVMDNTLILFVSDNGPDFNRMKKSVYEEGVRVPFMVRWPGHADAGLVRDEFVSTVDIFATFVSAATGQERPHGAGRPLQPLLRDREVVWRDSMLSQFIVHAPSQFYPSYAISTPTYQLIHNLDYERVNPVPLVHDFPEVRASLSPENRNHPFTAAYQRYASPPEFELYDLVEDPYFLVNLAYDSEYAEVVQRLQERLLQWRIQIADPLLDEEYRLMLRERYAGETRYIQARY